MREISLSCASKLHEEKKKTKKSMRCEKNLKINFIHLFCESEDKISLLNSRLNLAIEKNSTITSLILI